VSPTALDNFIRSRGLTGAAPTRAYETDVTSSGSDGSAPILKRLTREGWILRNVKGSHFHFTHPTKPGRVTVPHPRKEIRIGTLRNVFRQAGWNWKE